IIKDAQTHLAQQKIDQWQNGYPSLEIINNDIIKGNSYVIIDTKEETIATTMFTIQPEPTYTKIEGQWLRPVNEKYGVIHRLAIKASKRNQGIAKAIFKHFESVLINNSIPSMKVDTHRGNLGMQHMLKSIGYTYCGIIYLEDGNERFGFEKILEQ
ncbi:MAG: GNAT family N-acetyltransferase, partial [Salibacteraceae bacterium]